MIRAVLQGYGDDPVVGQEAGAPSTRREGQRYESEGAFIGQQRSASGGGVSRRMVLDPVFQFQTASGPSIGDPDTSIPRGIQDQAFAEPRSIGDQAIGEVAFKTGLGEGDYEAAGDEEQSPAPPLLTPELPPTPPSGDTSKKVLWWPWAVGGGVLVTGLVVAAVLWKRRKR